MARLVTVVLDLDTLPTIIAESVATALRVHGVNLEPAQQRECGRNAAASVVLDGEIRIEEGAVAA
jgi:hypothetical protein